MMLRIVLKILLLLWQFPQVIVGGIVHLCLLPFIEQLAVYEGVIYATLPKLKAGFCLGPFVFVPYFEDRLLFHEYGHAVQSRLLGPLYFFVIAIPSLIWWLCWKPGEGADYYSFYTERTADQLGGVQR